jgi:tetratricopeptide (TPR) repeat protein
LNDVSLRLSGCTLVIEDPAEPAANRAVARVSRGLAFKVKRAYDRAIDDYDEALKLNPADALAFHERGVIWLLKGDFDRAIGDFTDSIRLNAEYADTFYNRGHAYLQRGDARLALADFDRAITLDSNARTSTAGAKGVAEKGVAEFSAGDANADYFIGRGHANFILGKYREAAADYASARLLRPDEPYITLWLQTAQARSSGRDAGGQFQKIAIAGQKPGWPNLLLELFLGGRTPDAVLSAAANPSQRCQAQFYVAQWRLARVEQQTEGLEALRILANSCPKELVEHKMAVGELKRLSQ